VIVCDGGQKLRHIDAVTHRVTTIEGVKATIVTISKSGTVFVATRNQVFRMAGLRMRGTIV